MQELESRCRPVNNSNTDNNNEELVMRRWTVAAIIAMLVVAASAWAVPAKPGPRTFEQPDGSTFAGRLVGDEHYSFAETADGKVAVRNSTGWWTYAKPENGLLAPTSYIVGKDESPYPARLRPNAEAVARLPENAGKEINRTAEERAKSANEFFYGPGGTPEHPTKAAPNGRQYVVILLGDFTDSTFAKYAGDERAARNPYNPFPFGSSAGDDSAAQVRSFQFLTNGDSTAPFVMDSTVVGSLSNYYWEWTYNKCWWYGQVSYGKSGRTRAQANTTTTTYMQNAVTAADPFVNYYQGGSVNNLMIVHPGPGEEESADAADIWSASYTGLSLSNSDGANITRCIVVPQNAQLGVFAHELFHQAMAGPDLYDYGYSGTPWGDWSLMDAGSWNGIHVSGDAPAFPGGHLAYDCDGAIGTVTGYLTGKTDSISSERLGDGKYTIAALDSCGEARRGNVTTGIRLWRIRNNNFRDSGQVWFVENRRRTPPYEIGLPEDGLIITHIDTRMGGGTRFNDGAPNVRCHYSFVEQPGFDPNPLYAAGDSNLPRQPYNAAYSADDYNVGGYLENRIDSTSIPNSWINKSYGTTVARTGPWIYDISREGPYMTFNVLRTGFAAAAPLVSYQTATVLDPAGGGGANNNNGLLDPWETDSIKITFHNGGAAITAGAACSLYVLSGGQYVTVTPGWKTVGSGAIANNAQAQSASFVTVVAKDAPRFTDILFGAVFRSTTPSYRDTSNFTLRISPFNIERVYDFSQILVGGTTYAYRLKPADLAIWQDTLYVANANLDVSTWQTRIHKVRRNASTPVVSADTARSINNRGATQDAYKYLGGIDVDGSGNLWYSIQDSCFNIDRVAPTPTVMKKFALPNVAWGGTPMKRIRGVALGPSVVDTVGTDPMPGDSLWGYWQAYEPAFTESLYVIQKVATGTASSVRYSFAFADSAWGAAGYGAYGYSWWNGRAMEYDGMYLWTSSVWQNILIRRDPRNARVSMVLPGPSMFGSYGTYGVAHEATNAAGVPYAPSGSAAYQPYKRGNRHYLYCASMDEGKIYKILATDFFVPTPCDSVVATAVNASTNKVKFWKHNADTQKVVGYLIYRRDDANPPTHPADSYSYKRSSRVGSAVAAVDSFMDAGAKSKAMHYYTVVPLNYAGEAGYGASSPSNPLAVSLTDFSCALISGNSVTLRWATASETDLYKWVVERSPDGAAYTEVGEVAVNSPNPMGASYSFTDRLDEPGMYYYRIADVSLSGFRHYHDPLVVTFGAPAVYALGQNFPNPMGSSATAIKYALKAPGRTTLRVYNVLGEEVRTLVDRHQAANYYSVHWDGRDNGGRDVSNGVYFYKLSSGDFSDVRKLTVLK